MRARSAFCVLRSKKIYAGAQRGDVLCVSGRLRCKLEGSSIIAERMGEIHSLEPKGYQVTRDLVWLPGVPTDTLCPGAALQS